MVAPGAGPGEPLEMEVDRGRPRMAGGGLAKEEVIVGVITLLEAGGSMSIESDIELESAARERAISMCLSVFENASDEDCRTAAAA